MWKKTKWTPLFYNLFSCLVFAKLHQHLITKKLYFLFLKLIQYHLSISIRGMLLHEMHVVRSSPWPHDISRDVSGALFKLFYSFSPLFPPCLAARRGLIEEPGYKLYPSLPPLCIALFLIHRIHTHTHIQEESGHRVFISIPRLEL